MIFGRQEEEPPPEQRLGTSATTTAVAEPEQSGPREGLVLLLFTVVTVAAIAYVLVSAEHDAVNDPAAKARRGEIGTLDDLSLIREKNVRRILAKVASSSSPLVNNLRFSPTTADVTVQNENGDQTILHFDASFKETKHSFGTGSSDDAVAVQTIDPAAPERMVRTLLEKPHRGNVDYVTTSFLIEKRPDWTIALDQGPSDRRLWLADFHGRDVRRNGEPSTQQRRQTAKIKRDANRIQTRVRLQAKCLAKARDAEAAARCIKRFAP